MHIMLKVMDAFRPPVGQGGFQGFRVYTNNPAAQAGFGCFQLQSCRLTHVMTVCCSCRCLISGGLHVLVWSGTGLERRLASCMAVVLAVHVVFQQYSSGQSYLPPLQCRCNRWVCFVLAAMFK